MLGGNSQKAVWRTTLRYYKGMNETGEMVLQKGDFALCDIYRFSKVMTVLSPNGQREAPKVSLRGRQPVAIQGGGTQRPSI